MKRAKRPVTNTLDSTEQFENCKFNIDDRNNVSHVLKRVICMKEANELSGQKLDTEKIDLKRMQ